MNDIKRQYMMICASKRDYPVINDMLEVLVKWGYFERENTVWTYDPEDETYTYDIRDVDWKTAAFIGDILEAAVGHEIKWFHYNCPLDGRSVRSGENDATQSF